MKACGTFGAQADLREISCYGAKITYGSHLTGSGRGRTFICVARETGCPGRM